MQRLQLFTIDTRVALSCSSLLGSETHFLYQKQESSENNKCRNNPDFIAYSLERDFQYSLHRAGGRL